MGWFLFKRGLRGLGHWDLSKAVRVPRVLYFGTPSFLV